MVPRPHDVQLRVCGLGSITVPYHTRTWEKTTTTRSFLATNFLVLFPMFHLASAGTIPHFVAFAAFGHVCLPTNAAGSAPASFAVLAEWNPSYKA